jgi:hypothetical protein
MKTVKMIVLSLAAMAALVAFAHQSDPAARVKELNELRAQRLADARASGTVLDLNALNREIADKARSYVSEVDPARIEGKLGFHWATLFAMATMHREAVTAAERFIATANPSDAEKRQAQMLILESSNALGDGPALARLLPEVMKDAGALVVVSRFAPTYVATIARTAGPDEALRVLDEIEALVDFGALQQASRDSLRGSLALTRLAALEQAGRGPEGLQMLERTIEALGPDSAMTGRLRSTLTQRSMIGKPAPEIVFGEKHGEFTSLADLRGKVVILSFFAHW